MKPPHTPGSEKRNPERRRRTNLLEEGQPPESSQAEHKSQPEGGDPARRAGTQPQPHEGKTTRRSWTEENTIPT